MNRFYPHPIIAREGWPFIGGGFLAALLLTLCCDGLSWPFWLFTLFSLQFFRDPAREIPQQEDAVLSPVDGRIVVVERATDPYRQVEALKISVFMNVFNVHSQKSPADGTVTKIEYSPGKFLNADLDKASTDNERNAVLMTTATGREITFVQVAGLVARRILCYAKEGEKLSRGQRYGFIRFGSRVDVYLPVDARPLVSVGDKVTGVKTVLARLPLSATAAPEAPAGQTPPAAQAAGLPDAARGEQDLIREAAEKIRDAAEKTTRT